MACCTSKKKKIDLMIQNPDLLRLRLSPQEKFYYSNLFYEHSTNEKVQRNKFPALLGLLGTSIAENFALRIFDTFSADKKSIRLNEYLKYVDVYHYGDEIERCMVSFQLMDKTKGGEVNLTMFEEYINLLIAAIRKVHPGMSDNLFSSKDIKDLFNKIVNNNKKTFSYADFEKVYLEKPDLLSWIDYFKNNDEEVLCLINNNLRTLMLTLGTFFERFSNIMNEARSDYDLSPAINEIERFCKAIEKRRKVFVNSAGRFSIRTIFENLTKSFNTNEGMKKDYSPDDRLNRMSPGKSGSNKDVFEFDLAKGLKSDGHLLSREGSIQMTKAKGGNINKNHDENYSNEISDLNGEVENMHKSINMNVELPMFLRKLDSKEINEEFKNIKNNIIGKVNTVTNDIIIEENDDYDDIEIDETYNENLDNRVNIHKLYNVDNSLLNRINLDNKFENNKKINQKKNTNKTFQNKKVKDASTYIDAEISKIDDMINSSNYLVNKSIDLSKNEVILIDDSSDRRKPVLADTGMNPQNELLNYNSGSKLVSETESRDEKNYNVNKTHKNNKSLTSASFNPLNILTEDDPKLINNKIRIESNSNSKGYDKERENKFRKFNSDLPNLNVEKIKEDIENINHRTINRENIGKYRSETGDKKDKMNAINYKSYGRHFSMSNENKSPFEKTMNKFFKKMQGLSDTTCQMVKWIEQSYKWVENRYLKEHIKKNIHHSHNSKNKNHQTINDMRFSMTNIPKTNPAKPKSKSKGNLLKATDDNFKILLNVVMGIQLAVQSTPSVKIELNEDLSNYLHSLIYSIQTTNFGSKRQETFYIKEYAGILFNNIRKLYGINKDTFISSISPQDFITGIMVSGSTIIEELCSTGKSGSLFYYTRDGKYILKTISTTEYDFLKKILPNYFRHLQENKDSILPKFLGCYKLVRKVKKHKSRVHFVIMQNIFSTNKEIHLRYDLKGSKIGRQVLTGGKKFHTVDGKLDFALKDLDLENHKHYFFVGDKKETVMSQLNKDTKFLADNNIIDYSLLVGIHILDLEAPQLGPNLNKKGRVSSPIKKNSLTEARVSMEVGSPFKKETNLESHSQREHKLMELKLEENISECSMYNKEINFSDGSIVEENKKTLEFVKHPFKDFEDGGIKSETNKEIYFLGIIDILTEYNCSKSLEYMSKLVYYCSSKMSCIPPNPYRNRFNNYMNDKFAKVPESIKSENVETCRLKYGIEVREEI